VAKDEEKREKKKEEILFKQETGLKNAGNHFSLIFLLKNALCHPRLAVRLRQLLFCQSPPVDPDLSRTHGNAACSRRARARPRDTLPDQSRSRTIERRGGGMSS
jgi:hypothetical protein